MAPSASQRARAERMAATRVAEYLARPSSGIGSSPADLREVIKHSTAALRRSRDVTTALRAMSTAYMEHGDPSPEYDAASSRADETVPGDASQAVVSLYLAASAAERYCEREGESGPLGRVDLHDLVERSRHLRDAVVHWDEKGERDPQTFLDVSELDVQVYAPKGKAKTASSVVARVTWEELDRAVIRLQQWATFHLDPRAKPDGDGTA